MTYVVRMNPELNPEDWEKYQKQRAQRELEAARRVVEAAREKELEKWNRLCTHQIQELGQQLERRALDEKGVDYRAYSAVFTKAMDEGWQAGTFIVPGTKPQLGRSPSFFPGRAEASALSRDEMREGFMHDLQGALRVVKTVLQLSTKKEELTFWMWQGLVVDSVREKPATAASDGAMLARAENRAAMQAGDVAPLFYTLGPGEEVDLQAALNSRYVQEYLNHRLSRYRREQLRGRIVYDLWRKGLLRQAEARKLCPDINRYKLGDVDTGTSSPES